MKVAAWEEGKEEEGMAMAAAAVRLAVEETVKTSNLCTT